MYWALMAAKADEIGGHAAELAGIRRECANIDKSSDRIRGWAESAEKGIKAQVAEIVGSLRGAQGAPAARSGIGAGAALPGH